MDQMGKDKTDERREWEEKEQKEKRPTTSNPDETTGGAAHKSRYIRGRGGHGRERPELQEEEEAAAARIDKG